VTGSRSESGLLAPLIDELRRSDQWQTIVVATGDHVVGHADLDAISEQLGFRIDHLVESLVRDDDAVDVGRSIARGIVGFSDLIRSEAPDLVILIGDRFETYSAALACHLTNTPIAHVHGGEKTVGSMDEAFRHSITKFARLHYVAHDDYRRRVIQLGETPSSVIVVGGLGVDVIRRTDFIEDDLLTSLAGFEVADPYVMLSVHSESNSDDPTRATEVAIEVLHDFPELPVVASLSSSDVGALDVNRLITEFAKSRNNVRLINNMGNRLYLSLLRRAALIIGNSSSGILEAPVVGVPTVNIGSRQHGRVRPASVTDVGYDLAAARVEIANGLQRGRDAHDVPVNHTFGDGHASMGIVRHLRSITIPLGFTKEFYDL